MMLDHCLEAILFAAAKPFTAARLAQLLDANVEDVTEALKALAARLDSSGSALQVQRNGSEVELVTRPECAEVVAKAVNVEAQAELSRPSLETLTILAYRGPLTRPEIEQIRGVQSSMILRNLLMRGLIEQSEDVRLGQPVYSVSFEFLNHLGVKGVEDLPEYANLRSHTNIQDVLKQLEEVTPPVAGSDSPNLSV